MGSYLTSEAKNKVDCALLLDIVVCQRAIILQLLAGKNQTLLIGRDALLILNLSLDGFDAIAVLYIKRDGLASECLDEYLHPCTSTSVFWF